MSYETAVDATLDILRANGIPDEAAIAREHGITYYAAEAARRYSEDRVWNLDGVKPKKGVQRGVANPKQTDAYKVEMARRWADGQAASVRKPNR